MKADKMRELSQEELINEADDLEQELFNLRMSKVVSHIENPMRIRQLRRTIARAKTILNEYRLGIVKK